MQCICATCVFLNVLVSFLPFHYSGQKGLPVAGMVKRVRKSSPCLVLPTYRIPYRLTDTKHLLVRAKINGKGPFNFIVDTGSPAVFVAKETAARLGLAAKSNGWAVVKNLEIEGGAQVEQIQVRLDDPTQLTGMNALGLAGARIDGILGYNLLSRFRMEIDLTQPKMVWRRVNTPPDMSPVMLPSTGGKPYTPPASMAQMDSMAKMATALLGKMKSETTLRGFAGIELVAEPSLVKSPIIIGRKNGEIEGQKTVSQGVPNAIDAVRIARVLSGSPAAQSGVLAGDVVKSVAIGSAELQVVRHNADVMRLVQNLGVEDILHLQVQRGAQALDFWVRVKKGGF